MLQTSTAPRTDAMRIKQALQHGFTPRLICREHFLELDLNETLTASVEVNRPWLVEIYDQFGRVIRRVALDWFISELLDDDDDKEFFAI